QWLETTPFLPTQSRLVTTKNNIHKVPVNIPNNICPQSHITRFDLEKAKILFALLSGNPDNNTQNTSGMTKM
ncbi:hypothetical protein, partial [Eubacterium ramulus]